MEAMQVSFKSRALLAWVIILGLGSVAGAQDLQPFGPVSIEHYHDFQLFAPADLGDFGNQPEPHYGFFGSYERVAWHLSKPGAVTIGSNAAEGVYQIDGNAIFEENSGSTGGLTASMAWGNRFELGYMQDSNNGWLASVTQGLGAGQTISLNNALVLFDDPNGYFTPVFVDRNGDGFDDDLDGDFVFGRYGIDLGVRRERPDVIDIPAVPGVSETGTPGMGNIDIVIQPGAVVQPGGIVVDAGAITNEAGEVVVVTPAVPAQTGVPTGLDPVVFYAPPVPDGIPDEPFFTDFGDRTTILARFDFMSADNETSMDSIELMKMFRFDRNDYGGIWEVYGGARYTQVQDKFNLGLVGGYLDGTFVNTEVMNNMVGPQIGARYAQQNGRWNVSMEGRYMAAYNAQNTQQTSEVASGVNDFPGSVDDLPNPTLFAFGSFAGTGLYGKGSNAAQHNKEFSSLGEFRLNTTYSLSKAVALKVGYTMTYIGNVGRASNRVSYSLPNFGIAENQSGIDFFAHGVNFGVEINR